MTDDVEAIEEAPGAAALENRPHPFVKWLPLLVLVVGFGWRLVGIGWGLPNDLHNQSYHPDEQVIWAYAQQIEPTKLDFTPGFYNYGTLYLTVLRVASDVVQGYGGGPKENDPHSVWHFMGACHLAGRYVSALAGALAGLFVYLMLRRITNPLGATAGALLLLFSPSFLVHSRFQTVDVLATMLLAGALLMAVKLMFDPKPERWALWGAVFAGLSAGTKYTGALAMLPMLFAIFFRARSDIAFRLFPATGLAFVASMLAFLLATPGAVLESDKFLKDFKYEMLHTSTGHGLVFEGVGSGFAYHLVNLVHGLGPLALILSIIGLAWAAAKRQPWAFAILALALPYFVLIGRAEVLFIRYTFPLLVCLALGFGWLAGHAHDKRGWHMATVALGILSLGATLSLGAIYTALMAQPDARDVYAIELARRAESVGIATDPWYYTPPLIPDSAIMRGNLALQMEEMARAKPPLMRYFGDDPRTRQDWDVRLLTELKPHYVVLSNFEVGPVARLSETGGKYPQVDAFKAFHAELERLYEPMTTPQLALSPLDRYREATLLVEDLAYVRPQFWIWTRKP